MRPVRSCSTSAKDVIRKPDRVKNTENPDVAARHPAETGVVEEHEHDSESTHAVERRLIGESRSLPHVDNVRRASANGLMDERPQPLLAELDARDRARAVVMAYESGLVEPGLT